jgi:hypothetical protein
VRPTSHCFAMDVGHLQNLPNGEFGQGAYVANVSRFGKEPGQCSFALKAAQALSEGGVDVDPELTFGQQNGTRAFLWPFAGMIAVMVGPCQDQVIRKERQVALVP